MFELQIAQTEIYDQARKMEGFVRRLRYNGRHKPFALTKNCDGILEARVGFAGGSTTELSVSLSTLFRFYPFGAWVRTLLSWILPYCDSDERIIGFSEGSYLLASRQTRGNVVRSGG